MHIDAIVVIILVIFNNSTSPKALQLFEIVKPLLLQLMLCYTLLQSRNPLREPLSSCGFCIGLIVVKQPIAVAGNFKVELRAICEH